MSSSATLTLDHPIVSADSHITEAPGTYVDHIDPKYRDVAPRIVENDEGHEIYVVDGMKRSIPLNLIAAAGVPWDQLSQKGGRFEDLHRGGWDPVARIGDQERDGIHAEVIYPSVGMSICNHQDFDYKHACFQAYNRWIAEFCSHNPTRLLGCGQLAMQSVEDGIAGLQEIRDLGLRGVMMPGDPAEEDYDSEIYDPFWEAAIDLDIPISFHILTTRASRPRGPKTNSFLSIVRGNQDILGTFVFGGVFERHPDLKVVCVEADAGWAPHFMYRMDHAFKRHRAWLPPRQELSKLPSEYFLENIYLTFQDDFTAFRFADHMNWKRLCWANDFPHSDSTWPWSQEMLAEQTAHLTTEQVRHILFQNTADLYGIDEQELKAEAMPTAA